MEQEIIKIPAIVSDIDGVLILGSTPIQEGTEVIKMMQKPLSELAPNKFADEKDMRLPFILLTNGGGMSEDNFVLKINKIHNLTSDESNQLRKEQLILNYTPLKTVIQNQYQDKVILVGGHGKSEDIALYMGAKKYITVTEYLNIYPNIAPIKYSKQCQDTLQEVSQRLGMTPEELLKDHLQISAIFLLYDPDKWEEYIQLITDILTTDDGSISKTQYLPQFEQHIPLYCTSNDLTYQDTFRLPRIVFGCFNIALKSVYKLLYNRELKINQYGKPSPLTYQYAEMHCRNLIQEYNKKSPGKKYEISNFYMIGDNPSSDIQGAINAGWTSILVRTGVFKFGENSEQFPAKHVCQNVKEAIQLIFELENLI
ncbi:hypothetical protein ABPG72_018813 [Tetrahymena utriculariae]